MIKEGDPLLIPIPNTEEIWWSNQPLERQVTRKRKRGVPRPVIPAGATVILGEEEEVTFITNTTGDARLLDDVMLFPNPRESDSKVNSTSNSNEGSDDDSNKSSW